MNTFKTQKGTVLPLLDLRGKDYLQVAHRLVWFREEHPDWSIETEIYNQEDKSALGKATIKNAEGRIMATAHKCEDAKGFADFKEKAETGAIGRALALVGYGTQFAPDIDEEDRVVDSPITRKNAPQSTKTDQDACECGNKMMVSKHVKNSYYCTKCKRSKPIESFMTQTDQPHESDIPF